MASSSIENDDWETLWAPEFAETIIEEIHNRKPDGFKTQVIQAETKQTKKKSGRRELITQFVNLLRKDFNRISACAVRGNLYNKQVFMSDYIIPGYGNLLILVNKMIGYYTINKGDENNISSIRGHIESIKQSLRQAECDSKMEFQKLERHFVKDLAIAENIPDGEGRVESVGRVNKDYLNNCERVSIGLATIQANLSTKLIEYQEKLIKAEEIIKNNKGKKQNVPLEIAEKVFNIVRKNSRDTEIFFKILLTYLSTGTFIDHEKN